MNQQMRLQLQLQLQRQFATNHHHHHQQQHQQLQHHQNFNLSQQQQQQQHGLGSNAASAAAAAAPAGSSDAIAQALSQLSLQQRDEVYQDIHGIVDSNAEVDPQQVARSLTLLEQELVLQSTPDSAYQKALFYQDTQQDQERQGLLVRQPATPPTSTSTSTSTGSAYVQDPDFRLMFLRAEEWNVKSAAKRMIAFMELKLQLFGIQKLCRDIVLDDLKHSDGDDGSSNGNGSSSDWNYLECGYFQRIPLNDRSGRKILLVWPQFPRQFSAQSVLRTAFYIIMSIAHRDPHAQTLGMVEINYEMRWTLYRDDHSRHVFNQLHTLRSLMPIRTAAIHGITNDPAIKLVVEAVRHIFPPRFLSRIKIHSGRYMETQYELLSYGIPVNALPFDLDGNWTTGYHHQWLQLQHEAEKKHQREQQLGKLKNETRPSSATALASSGEIQPTPNPSYSAMAMDTAETDAATPTICSSSTTWGTCSDANRSYYMPPILSGTPPPTPMGISTTTSRRGSASPSMSCETSAAVTSSSGGGPTIIFQPEPMDVLLGSGHTIDDRPGNVRFRRLLSEHLERYDRAGKLQKTSIAQNLVKHFKETQNVRFLQRRLISSNSANANGGGGGSDQDSNSGSASGNGSGVGWVEVDDKTVREKISRTFRRLRQNTKK